MKVNNHAVKASNHAVARYLERELHLEPRQMPRRINADGVARRALNRERRVAVQAARREIERVFHRPRMAKVLDWANGASFRVIDGGRVYCCRGGTVTTFYRRTRKR